MRTAIYFLIIVFLFFSGIRNFINSGKTNTPPEVPFLSGDLGISELSLFASPEEELEVQPDTLQKGIVPEKEDEPKPLTTQEEIWTKTLLGNWQYSMIMESKKKYHVIEGSVEYKADGTFERYVTHEFYLPYWSDDPIRRDFDRKKIGMIAGGILKGKWSVSPSKYHWKEDNKFCQIKKSEGKGYLDTCKKYFNGTVAYGNAATNTKKLNMRKFKKDRIEIKGKNFQEGADITYKMWR